MVVVLSPFAVAGLFANLVPALIVLGVGLIPTAPLSKGTIRLLAAAALFPLTWISLALWDDGSGGFAYLARRVTEPVDLLLGSTAWDRSGALAAIVVLVAMPVLGAIALTLVERMRGLFTDGVGWAAIAAGLASVAYHGPGTAAGRYAHDAGLLPMLGFVAVADAELAVGREAPPIVLGGVPVVAALGAHPVISMSTQLAVGVGAVIGETARIATAARAGRPWHRRAEVGVTAAGAAAHLLGGTGGPWCRPDSLLQPHAVWPVATAGAIWLRRVAVTASA